MDLQVRVLGEAFTPDDEEDSTVAEVTSVWVYQARYRTPLNKAVAGELHLPEPFYRPLCSRVLFWSIPFWACCPLALLADQAST